MEDGEDGEEQEEPGGSGDGGLPLAPRWPCGKDLVRGEPALQTWQCWGCVQGRGRTREE